MIEQTYIKLIGKHPQSVAFILGAGTSLYDIITDHKDKFNSIFNHVVIAVNSSILIMDHQDKEKHYWLSVDSRCRDWTWWKQVKISKLTKVVVEKFNKCMKGVDDTLYFCARPHPRYFIDPEDIGLECTSSSPAAIDLAIQMGCKEIYLLGFDHYMAKGCSHFWQLWDKESQPKFTGGKIATHKSQREIFVKNTTAFNAMKRFADAKNVIIYNCNPNSKVNVFKKIEFFRIRF